MNIKKIFLILLLLCSSSIINTAMSHKLVNVQSITPTIVTDLKYATPDNFTHQAVYPSCAKCYLVDEAAQALKKAQEELFVQGLGLKIWDAYRPHAIQYILWNFLMIVM